MGIFRETPIEWGDKEYTLVPNMKLLRKIEMGSRIKEIEPFSLSRLVSDSLSGAPQVPLMAHVVELVMRHAGADDFTEDEFYQEMQVGDKDAAIACWWTIIAAISPVPKEEKKVAA